MDYTPLTLWASSNYDDNTDEEENNSVGMNDIVDTYVILDGVGEVIDNIFG